jgi:ribonuclease HI
MPNGGPAGAGYVVVGGVHLLGSEALGDATNNVAEYTAVRDALRAAADAGATSAHVRMDSPVVFGHLSGASRARAEHLIQLKEEVEAQVARYPGRVTFARIPREQNGVADELAKGGARASMALSADRRRQVPRHVYERGLHESPLTGPLGELICVRRLAVRRARSLCVGTTCARDRRKRAQRALAMRPRLQTAVNSRARQGHGVGSLKSCKTIEGGPTP